MTHEPSGFIGTEAHIPIELQSAHAFLANEHQVNNAIPFAERFIRIFKNRPGNNREPIAVRCTCPALPMEGFVRRGVIKIWIAATRTTDAIRPATRNKIRTTRGFVGEQFFELCRRKLMNWLWLLCSGHGILPSDGRRMAYLGKFVTCGISLMPIRGHLPASGIAATPSLGKRKRSEPRVRRPASGSRIFHGDGAQTLARF